MTSSPEEPTPESAAWLDELDAVLSPAAVIDLTVRRLLPPTELIARAAGAAVPSLDAPAETALDDRIAGALLGAAIGSALGGPVRGLTAADIRQRFGRIEGYLGGATLEPATTSDGQLLELWAAVLGRHELDAAPAFAAALPVIGPALRGPGRATRHTIERLAAGVPWYAAAPGSYGDAAIVRAVADGCRFATEPGRRLISAALGSVVTHAHPRAVYPAMVVADAVARLVVDPQVVEDRVAFITDVAAVAETKLQNRLCRHVGGPRLTKGSLARGSSAADALVDAFAAFFVADDPLDALVAAVNAGGDTDIVGALVGALAGAAHGTDVFPDEWRVPLVDLERVQQATAALIAARHAASSGTAAAGSGKTRSGGRARSSARRRSTRRGAAGAAPGANGASVTGGAGIDASHIWFLLDRSGSMQSLQRAVVDGFNEFLAERGGTPMSDTDAAKERITVAQFDSQDPYEVIIDAEPPASVAPLQRHQYEPRAATPLYDAIGSLLDAADARLASRAAAGLEEEDQLVVVFTDGMENASQTWSSSAIHGRIGDCRKAGWTFVFLGANQDSYATGEGLAVAAGSTSNFDATYGGHRAAWGSVRRSYDGYRMKPRAARVADQDDFFDGVKEAENHGG